MGKFKKKADGKDEVPSREKQDLRFVTEEV